MIANARNEAASAATNLKYNARSNKLRRILIDAASGGGEYSLTVTAAGFERAISERLALHVRRSI